jgi:chorismate mutase
MHERATSLSGELKAAREAQGECVKALTDQERLVTIAAKAVERADARVLELLTERELLADKMAEAIRQVGEAPVADEAAPAVAFEVTDAIDGHKEIAWVPQADDPITRSDVPFADLHTPGPFPNAIFNGIDRAYDEATQP